MRSIEGNLRYDVDSVSEDNMGHVSFDGFNFDSGPSSLNPIEEFPN